MACHGQEIYAGREQGIGTRSLHYLRAVGWERNFDITYNIICDHKMAARDFPTANPERAHPYRPIL